MEKSDVDQEVGLGSIIEGMRNFKDPHQEWRRLIAEFVGTVFSGRGGRWSSHGRSGLSGNCQ